VLKMSSTGNTGDKVKVAGTYKNRFGKEVALKENDVFPSCPVKGNPIQWEKVE
jgi:hypothetical protein